MLSKPETRTIHEWARIQARTPGMKIPGIERPNEMKMKRALAIPTASERVSGVARAGAERNSRSNGLSCNSRLDPTFARAPSPAGPLRNRRLTARINTPETRKAKSAPMKVRSTQFGIMLVLQSEGREDRKREVERNAQREELTSGARARKDKGRWV